MLLGYNFNIDIQKNSEILDFFYPKINTKQNLIVTNKEDLIIKICENNNAVTDLMEKLDLVVV
jgi:hypothetical protein